MTRDIGKTQNIQKGMTLISMAFLLAFLAVIAVIAVKVFPVYARNIAIKNSIESTLASNDVSQMNIANFRREAMKSIDQANGIRDFDASTIVYTREGSFDYIDVNYEYRIDLFTNIDVVISFQNRFDQ